MVVLEDSSRHALHLVPLDIAAFLQFHTTLWNGQGRTRGAMLIMLGFRMWTTWSYSIFLLNNIDPSQNISVTIMAFVLSTFHKTVAD